MKPSRRFVVIAAQVVVAITTLTAADCAKTTVNDVPGIVARGFLPATGSYKSFIGDTVAVATGVFSTIPVPQSTEMTEITDAQVDWTSSNANVVAFIPVGASRGRFAGLAAGAGVFKSVGVGTATITGRLNDPRITTESGGPITYSATVTVSTGTPLLLNWNPSTVTLNVGGSADVVADLRSSTGFDITSIRLEAIAMDPSIATFVGADGKRESTLPAVNSNTRTFPLLPGTPMRVTALTPGTARFTLRGESGTSGSVRDLVSTLTVVVRAPAVATTVSVVTVPATGSSSSSIAIAATRQLAAVVRDQNGQTMSSSAVTWTSSNTAVATVNSSGLVTGTASGTAVITARSVDVTTISASHTVTVLPAAARADSIAWGAGQPDATRAVGQQFTYTASVLDQFRAPYADAVITWEVANPAIASVVSQTNGATPSVVIRANAAGTTTIRPTIAGVTKVSPATQTIVVAAASSNAIVSIFVSPMHIGLAANETQQYTAHAFNAAGTDVSAGVTFLWFGTNAAASVSTSGLVTALSTGGALVTATAQNVYGTGAVSVGAVGSILAPNVNTAGGPMDRVSLIAFQGTVEKGTGITNRSGRGYIPGLAPGTYTVVVSMHGFRSQTFDGIIVTQNNTTSLPAVTMVPQ